MKKEERDEMQEREVLLKKFRKKKVKLESKKKKKTPPLQHSKCLITQKKHFRSRQNKQTEKKRKISVYGTEEDPEGEAVEDVGRTMAEQIKASVSKGVDKVKLM